MSKPSENINIQEYAFSEAELESLLKTQKDFINGKTTARDWNEIEEELKVKYKTGYVINRLINRSNPQNR